MLEGAPLRREYLIENLHRVQDRFGHLSAAHLTALAEAMKLSQAEVYEVATFYHHFDVVKEGEAAPAAVTVRVCETLSCRDGGRRGRCSTSCPACVGPNVRVIAAPCIGRCAEAPAVCVGQNAFGHATRTAVKAVLDAKQTSAPALQPIDYAEYRGAGRLQDVGRMPVGQARGRRRHQDDGGLGAARPGRRGLPRRAASGRSCAPRPAPRLMAVNIDEGEPGTFKDRHYLERDPHRFLEGMLIAAWAVGIEDIYVYLRDEYHACREMLERELAALKADPPRASCRASTCAAARAPTSAAKSPR